MPASPAATAAVNHNRPLETLAPQPSYEVVFGEYFPYSVHPPVLPATVHKGRDSRRAAVVIVGGGPTGLTLALDLANHGIASVVIEADPTVCSGSRAGAFTRRTLEIMDQIGVADDLVSSGLGWNRGWTYYRDELVYESRIPDSPGQRFPATLSQLQNLIEERLVTRAEAHGDRVDIRWHSKVVAFEPGSEGARLVIEHPQGSYEMDADWVVACDGGRSTIRQAMGLMMEGQRHAGRYAIIDVRIDTSDFPVGRRWWFDPPSNPGGTLIMFKKPGGMLRFDYQLRDDEATEEAMQPERVLDKVRRHLQMLGVDKPWEPVWMSLYRASALTLPSYRHGRVLFAGDAAHLVPIFGVRGMNSAVEDAHNLAWKLAWRIRGLAGDALLDTYSAERVPAARENLRYASKGAEFMSPPSEPHRLMRDAVLSLSARHPALTTLMSPRQHAANDCAGSPLNLATADEARFSAGPRPGMVLPDGPLKRTVPGGVSDAHLTQLLGPCFTLLHFTGGAGPGAALAAAVQALDAVAPMRLCRVGTAAQPGAADLEAIDTDGRLHALYGAAPAACYLVRPDGHLLARWLTPPSAAELRAALDPVIGHQPVAA
ncbi:FAD-dependent monooxygenase [Pseudorhodoferax sp.]|uniref:FAD-dependent monooxygenase n=1 Tax=Pseudorhodoferax sp. TaxID=1993553 RepID=UPI002DD66B74|nr:FAD-dependent monooxygenase [Pseudorhodoferax sp.]